MPVCTGRTAGRSMVAPVAGLAGGIQELIRTNDKVVGVKRDYKTGAIGRKEDEN